MSVCGAGVSTILYSDSIFAAYYGINEITVTIIYEQTPFQTFNFIPGAPVHVEDDSASEIIRNT